MELLKEHDVINIAKQCGFSKVVKWNFEDFEEKLIGYLGDHLNLIIEVEDNGIKSKLTMFVKCMPRFNKWKADYLKESAFFKKEYTMLKKLFNEFENFIDSHKWRPKVLFLEEDLFVFENVTLQGYNIPNNQETLTFEQLTASIATLARFHAQSYIFEERKSKELGRTYRIWEQYSDYLQEPSMTKEWRDTGRNAVIDFLKVFSKYKSKPNFSTYLETIVPPLFDGALELMKPSLEYRNVVVHRDLWANNIFLKEDANLGYHAIFVDFQTVVYASPMIDLSSLIYFNTSKTNRIDWTQLLIDFYYTTLTNELKAGAVNVEEILPKSVFNDAYDKSVIFGITQACIITPIVAINKDKREELFCNPETCETISVVTRSKEFIDVAKEDGKYRTKIIDLFDEVVERFVFTKDIHVVCDKNVC